MVVDDGATQEAPAGGPLPTTDLGPAPAPDDVLAYSDSTSSMPVIDYQAPRLQPVWIIVLVLLAAAAVGVATFVLGRTTASQEPASALSDAQAGVPVEPPTVTVTAESTPAGAPTWTAADIEAETRLSPMDKRFVLLLPAEPFNHHDPISLSMSANSACRMLYQGSTREKVLSYVASPETDVGHDAGVAFLNAAVMVYCPNAG